MESDALIYPGARFDPEWRHFPLGAPFVVGHGATRHSIYSPLFAAVSVPGWLAGGYTGTLFLPALAAVEAALLAMHLARLAGHGPLAAAFAGAMTLCFAPVAVYGVTMSEHSLGVALVLLAFVLVERSVVVDQSVGVAQVLRFRGPLDAARPLAGARRALPGVARSPTHAACLARHAPSRPSRNPCL